MAIVCVPLKRKGQTHIMKIDYEDWQKFKNYKWYVNSKAFHISRNSSVKERLQGKKSKILLHREILKAPTTKYVDHINRDPLDNRRNNLRICTAAENLRNRNPQSNSSTKEVGIYYLGYRKTLKAKWLAKVVKNKKQYCRYFTTKEEAIAGRHCLAKKLFGAFAPHLGEANG